MVLRFSCESMIFRSLTAKVYYMSDNLGNIEVTIDNEQPLDDVVSTNEELESTPQDTSTDEFEVVIEDEDDQETTSKMSQSQAYAAFRKEKKAKQNKTEALKAEQAEKEQLRKELEELKASVNSVTNPKPTIENCDYDQDVFAEKLEAWFGSRSVAPKAAVKKEVDTNDFNESLVEAEFTYKQQESELSKHVKGYADSKAALIDNLSSSGVNEQTFLQLASIANDAGVDMAKATLALSKSPKLVEALEKACVPVNGIVSQVKIANALSGAASKVKLNKRSTIDTKPEADVKNGGPIDNKTAAVAKARKAWQESKTGPAQISAWNEYQRIKKS
jgi:hypothetical protein